MSTLEAALTVLGSLAARTHAGLPPAADDNQAGTNTALHDECELIYGMPAYSAARDGLKRRIASDPYYEASFRRIAGDELAPDLADFADRLLNEIDDEQQKGEL